MQFRRELDFDDLIETIDQLADEQIDEVVDWQMTESPAAKTEGIKSGRQAVEIGQRLANRAIQYGGQIAGVAAQGMAETFRQPREVERYELPPDRRGEIVIPNVTAFDSAWNPIGDPRRTLDVTYQRITHDVQTIWDPMRDILHIRLAWSLDGRTFRYQQVGVSRQILEDMRTPVELVRSEEITPGRTIAVYLDPEARNRQYPIRVFMESPR